MNTLPQPLPPVKTAIPQTALSYHCPTIFGDGLKRIRIGSGCLPSYTVQIDSQWHTGCLMDQSCSSANCLKMNLDEVIEAIEMEYGWRDGNAAMFPEETETDHSIFEGAWWREEAIIK